MSVRIITLSENTAQLDFLGEWGLSILVETESCRVLLDTGQKMAAVHNADLMGIDLSTIDKIVLSHAHGDHTGGLREVLRRAKKGIEIVAHPDIWIPRYVRFGEADRYVGMPFLREDLESFGASFTLTRKPFQISDEIMTTGEIEMTNDYETIDDRLYAKKGGKMIPDPLADDLALIVRTAEGLAVITGCAHRGIMNTVRHVQKLTGRRTHTHHNRRHAPASLSSGTNREDRQRVERAWFAEAGRLALHRISTPARRWQGNSERSSSSTTPARSSRWSRGTHGGT